MYIPKDSYGKVVTIYMRGGHWFNGILEEDYGKTALIVNKITTTRFLLDDVVAVTEQAG